jgi:hypothetical protein
LAEAKEARGEITLKRIPIRRQFGHRASEGPPAEPPDFTEARALFTAFRERRERALDPRIDWIREAEDRLRQTEWTVRRLHQMQVEYESLSKRRFTPDGLEPRAVTGI